MLTKKEIDDYFVNIIPMLTKTAKGIKYKQNKGNLETDVIINETYLHIQKNMDIIKENKDIEKIATQFIKMNIGWQNSQLNKMEKVNNNYQSTTEDDEDDFSQDKTITETFNDEEDFDIELEQKLEIERWYNEKKCLLAMYRQQEKNKINQIIYDCFFIKDIKTGKQLAEHLKMDKGAAWRYIRIMKQSIKKYVDNYKQ
jgi:hypothetical protein